MHARVGRRHDVCIAGRDSRFGLERQLDIQRCRRREPEILRNVHVRAVVETSPLGILIHPEYGLWFGLRGVLFVNVENQQVEKLIQPPQVPAKLCQECTEKPCLSACPVNAFGDEGLNVKSCFSHLERVEKSAASPNCLEVGCAARAACPVANEHQYSRDQLQFHMHAYYR